VHSHKKNCGNHPQGFHQTALKRILFFFLSLIQRGLSNAYPTPILTMFERTDVNQCATAYTREKFPKFYVGVLQAPENCLHKRYFGWGACYHCKAQMARFWAIESFRGLVNIPRMYRLYVRFDGECTVWAL